MKNLKINSKNYEPCIEGENITLIGLDSAIGENIILLGGGYELERDAEEAATYMYEDQADSDGYYVGMDKEVKQDYILDNIISFCEEWLRLGKPVEILNENLN